METIDDNRLPRKIMKWIPKERKRKEKPRRTWGKGVRRAINERNFGGEDWRDRIKWKLGIGQRRKTL